MRCSSADCCRVARQLSANHGGESRTSSFHYHGLPCLQTHAVPLPFRARTGEEHPPVCPGKIRDWLTIFKGICMQSETLPMTSNMRYPLLAVNWRPRTPQGSLHSGKYPKLLDAYYSLYCKTLGSFHRQRSSRKSSNDSAGKVRAVSTKSISPKNRTCTHILKPLRLCP